MVPCTVLYIYTTEYCRLLVSNSSMRAFIHYITRNLQYMNMWYDTPPKSLSTTLYGSKVPTGISNAAVHAQLIGDTYMIRTCRHLTRFGS